MKVVVAIDSLKDSLSSLETADGSLTGFGRDSGMYAGLCSRAGTWSGRYHDII